MLEGLVLDKGLRPWKLRLGFLSIYGLFVASILLAPAGLTLLALRADRGPPTFDRAAKSHVRRAMRINLCLPQIAGLLEDEPERGDAKLGAELSQDRALAP